MGLFNSKKRQQQRLRDLLGEAELPMLPGSATKILDKLRDEDASLDEVAQAIQLDPEVVTRLLKVVNSAAYGLRSTVKSVAHAVQFIGRANLHSLVLGLAVQRALPKGKAEGFDHKLYVYSAVRRAMLAKSFATRLHPATQAEDFTAALLQDMAIPLLAFAKPEQYGEVLRRWREAEGVHLEQVETEVLGWDHGEIGALVGEAWSLPPSLVESIGSHHTNAAQTTPAVRLASLMRTKPGHLDNEELIEAAKQYGLDSDWCLEVLEQSVEQTSELANLMT